MARLCKLRCILRWTLQISCFCRRECADRHLSIVSYHSSVVARKKSSTPQTPPVRVPTVRVKLVSAVKVPLRRCIMARVEFEGNRELEGPILIESTMQGNLVTFADSIVSPVLGQPTVNVTIYKRFTQRVEQGVELGQASEARLVDEEVDVSEDLPDRDYQAVVRRITSKEDRQQKLASVLAAGPTLQDKDKLYAVLLKHHAAFAL